MTLERPDDHAGNCELTSLTKGTCLVTGGAGFIGCALSEALTGRYAEVVAVDTLHPQIHRIAARPAALHRGVRLVVDDVTDGHAWDRLLAVFKPDVIIHLAAETGTGQSLTESERHGRVNVCGTTTMLDALARAGHVPQRFVLASSRAVYGEGAWLDSAATRSYPRARSRAMLVASCWDFPGLSYRPCTAAGTWPQPCSVYGATKLAQEHLLNAWCTAYGASLSVLRLQNVYGPGQSLTNSYTGIVSLFCRLAREGKPIPVYEDGAMLRDFILINDVARALIAATEDTCPAGPIDIGTGLPTPLLDVARGVATLYGAPEPVVTGQYRFGDVRHAACDIEASLAALPEWQPRFGLQDGLTLLAAWIETQMSEARA